MSKRVPYFPVFVLRPYCQPSEAFSPMMLIMSPSINDILVSPSPSCEYTALTCSPDVGGGGGTTRPWGRVFAVNKCLFLNAIKFLFSGALMLSSYDELVFHYGEVNDSHSFSTMETMVKSSVSWLKKGFM